MATAGQVDTDPKFQNYDPGWKSNAPPFDARYPHQNQMSNCLRNYLDYHRCRKIMGEDYVNCYYFKKVYTAKCNDTQVEKWDELMEKDAFAYKL